VGVLNRILKYSTKKLTKMVDKHQTIGYNTINLKG